ncbi:MAG: NADH-quinone oxidoreductase subunit J [Chloroflexi bacterium]|nr:MAG: NADH-quinone oxidoreductase subunit J [Chloroflexota bacterium]
MVLQAVFIVVALGTLAAALGAVLVKNLFHAALFLVGAFAGVAVLYVLLNAEFLAAAQIIIYIGAISTLIVFAIMLTRSVMGREAGQLNRYALVIAGALVLLFAVLSWLLNAVDFNATMPAVPDDAIAQIGQGFVSTFVIPFEAASVLLLVALVGAIMLARERHP